MAHCDTAGMSHRDAAPAEGSGEALELAARNMDRLIGSELTRTAEDVA